MKKVPTERKKEQESPSTYAERLAFVVWFAVLKLGVDGPTKLSLAIGKGGNTLSKWANDQPSFEQSEILADAVGVNATWLHNPMSSGAVAPDLFAEWLVATRLAADASAGNVPLTRGKRQA